MLNLGKKSFCTINSLRIIELENDPTCGHISSPSPVLPPKAVRIHLGRVGRKDAPRISSAPFLSAKFQRKASRPAVETAKRRSGCCPEPTVEPPFEAPFAAQGRQDKPHSKRWAEKQSGVEPPHSKNQRLM